MNTIKTHNAITTPLNLFFISLYFTTKRPFNYFSLHYLLDVPVFSHLNFQGISGTNKPVSFKDQINEHGPSFLLAKGRQA